MEKNSITKLRVIVGLGKTGLSCAHFLRRQGIPFAVTDSRSVPPGLNEFQRNFPTVPITVGQFDNGLILQAAELIVNPGIAPTEPALGKARQQGISIIGDIELFARYAKAPIVAITGSNAKGTVTTLVGDMASAAGIRVKVGGNIGIPALDLLNDNTAELYVLELSSFQLETTFSLHTIAATILNISADHLDRYQSIKDYAAVKQRIYTHCETIIYNLDDALTFPPNIKSQKFFTFGSKEPKHEHEFGLRKLGTEIFLVHDTANLLPVKELRIKGQHNWLNALAALALGTAINLPVNAMIQALREFKGLPHRCEWVAEQRGVQWYNDSKGTNVGATIAAIEGLSAAISGRLVLIAGGLGKGADFSILREPIAKHVKTIVLIGRDADKIAQALVGVNVVFERADSLESAVIKARQAANVGDAVLLSPACASWDMFRDYEQRGEIFMSLVRGLEA